MSKAAVCGLKCLNFLAQVCCTFFWQTKSALPQLIFPPLSRGVFSLFAVLVFWLFDRLKVPELCEKNDSLLYPLAVTVDLIVSVGNTGPGHNHSHTATPVDGHSFWQGSQRVLQVLCGLQQSEWVIECVSERLSSITTKREGWRPFAQISFPLSGQTAVKKKKKDPAQASVCRNFAKTG